MFGFIKKTLLYDILLGNGVETFPRIPEPKKVTSNNSKNVSIHGLNTIVDDKKVLLKSLTSSSLNFVE